MDGTLYKKVEEVKDRFYELYGKEVYTNFNLSDKVTAAYYEINDLLIAILNEIEMGGYDGIEE
jgi:TfoX/Sxy family transcriptional regulator of competence genes